MENAWKSARSARERVGEWARGEEGGAACEGNAGCRPGDADEREARSLSQLVGGTWFRCFAGLTFAFLGTWLLNQYLFPSFMGVYPLAREAATVASCATYLFVALLATRRPSIMHPGYLALVGLSLHILGFAVVMTGLVSCQPAVLTVGVIAMNAGRSVISLYAGVALVTLTAPPAALAIASAAACSHALRWAIAAAPDLVGFVVLAAAPFAIVAFALNPVSSVLDYARTRPDAGTLALTEPQSFLPFAHVLFVAFFVFRIAWGFSLTFNAVEGVPVTTALALVPVGAVALYVLFARCAASADVLYRVSSLLVLAGFLAILVPQAMPILASGIPNTLLVAGGDCFIILFYYTLAAVGRRNVLNALPAFAWGQCATSSGTLAGTALGHLANTLALHDVLLLPGAIALVVFAFAAFNQCALHGFSFDRTIAGVEPVVLVEQRGASESKADGGEAGAFEGEAAGGVAEESPAAEGVNLIERQCEAVAAEFGLTERETEVFRLLARGRNVPFIEEELIISRNTIKTHIKHIYQKLDVHSQQELIDMTELR